MKRVDNSSDPEIYVNALIYGPTGTGKTRFGGTAPKPLIILSESQGKTSLMSAAAETGSVVPQIIHVDDIEDVRNICRSLKHKNLNEKPVIKDKDGNVLVELDYWPETIVLDSYTDICELIVQDINRVSPPKIGKDGLEVMNERFWGTLKDKCARLVREFRDMPYHVIFLCLYDDRTRGEGEAAVRKIGPALPLQALPGIVAQATNVVGITYRTQVKVQKENEKPKYNVFFGIRTTGPDFMMTKPMKPVLNDYESPDFSDWVRRIRANISDGVSAVPPEDIQQGESQ